jgi:hypothetical protein
MRACFLPYLPYLLLLTLLACLFPIWLVFLLTLLTSPCFFLPFLPSFPSHPIYSPHLPLFLTIPSTISSPLLTLPSLHSYSYSTPVSCCTYQAQPQPQPQAQSTHRQLGSSFPFLLSFFTHTYILTYIQTHNYPSINRGDVSWESSLVSGAGGTAREVESPMGPPTEGVLACVS